MKKAFTRTQTLKNLIFPGRVLLVYGPRRVGKTTLVKEYLKTFPESAQVLYVTGDDISLGQTLGSSDRAKILSYVKPYDVIAVDEAHLIKNIGVAAKIIVDEFPEKKIILTGSSSFELSQYIGEPLVGRHFQVLLLPIAQDEIFGNNFDKQKDLDDFIIYGSYPEVLSVDNNQMKQLILRELVSSYLFKDILSFEKIKSPELLLKITKALAFQIGSEVSINKLAKDIGNEDPKTVKRYVELLEKTFIIKKVYAYSNNPRKEISTKVKYYFYDTGVRNAVIESFQGLENRSGNDIGGLWENFIFMELFKLEKRDNPYFDHMHFWRNDKNKEIDIVIQKSDTLIAYETKYTKDYSENIEKFLLEYPQSTGQVINRENYLDILKSV
jgi:predicted AAA+ superfamily ATPase